MTSEPILLTVGDAEEGQRLDVFISERTEMTRSRVQELLGSGHITVKGKQAAPKPSSKVHPGYEITVNIPEPVDEGELTPEKIQLDIMYSDDELVVINKPPALVVYPAAGNETGTLMNALKYRFDKLATVGGPLRPGVVHRLDKDTSGVMVVALTDKSYYSLVGQFKDKTTSRLYHALVNGSLNEDEGVIDAPIGRSTSDRKKMSTKCNTCKEARTHWRVLLRFPGATLVEVRLDTGRTHQIRVHFSSIGHSVLGDSTYGRKLRVEYKGRRVDFPRQMLHAYLLRFDHPVTGERMEFTAEPPQDMQKAIEELREL